MAAWPPRFPMKKTRGQLLDSGVPGFPRVRLLLLQWACRGLRLCRRSCAGTGCGYDALPVWTGLPCATNTTVEERGP